MPVFNPVTIRPHFNYFRWKEGGVGTKLRLDPRAFMRGEYQGDYADRPQSIAIIRDLYPDGSEFSLLLSRPSVAKIKGNRGNRGWLLPIAKFDAT